MMGSVSLVGLKRSIRVGVGRWKRKKSVVRGSVVRLNVVKCLGVGKGVMKGNVTIIRCRGGERVHVGNGFMKGWGVMLWCRLVVGRVIRSCGVGFIGVRGEDVIGFIYNRFLVIKMKYVKVNAKECGIVDAKHVNENVVMVLLVQSNAEEEDTAGRL
ncbi:hypothetical protein M8C21_019367 [Ambrosia artemisiifolia]|uniref:Uncharacterized protein n=1 Tax=Ambrosia artemisiifolia TaxID=4212 RepID=A0AAD5GNC9_AMBAR|nr:hypothetical protein M8C21_019367 [Ambrosia artemisiifolia]